ncbi:hypothetical protein [Cellulomonas palmilytica]|uniref:hypothetical protein n=1 Tax=Cellulomonas palmilytica TaxID=2608402 RepID=UPI001F415020|nr:hypothetical protein [Cellulomonas palmilytica]UJP40879.1 hypothetical protein F1D97_05220 [Cellulomonas palmilytica]
MTTFEDLDLGEAFGDFGDAAAEPRRRSRAWGAAAFLLAIALLVAGLVWVNAARQSPLDVSATPTAVVPALAAEQTAADRITDADLGAIDVVATTTRRLGTSAWGEHYVGLTASGSVCLLTVVEGDLPGQSCARPTTHLALTTSDVDGRDVVWLAAQGAEPSDEGWQLLAPNLWVRD